MGRKGGNFSLSSLFKLFCTNLTFLSQLRQQIKLEKNRKPATMANMVAKSYFLFISFISIYFYGNSSVKTRGKDPVLPHDTLP
jgi:hypothetical protein